MADRLEQEYQGAVATGQWQCKVVLTSGDWVMLHSPEVMMHFPVAAALAGALDDWGQVGENASPLPSSILSFKVQPQVDPALKPRVVHRGLEGLPDIPDGETNQVAPRLVSYGAFTPISPPGGPPLLCSPWNWGCL